MAGKPKRGACQCTNHLGEPKRAHQTKRAAVTYAASHYRRYTGTMRIYRCPTSASWHVTSQTAR